MSTDMSTDLRRSAKIYQFPRRPPTNVGVSSRQGVSVSDRWARTIASVDCGAWYHDAAIQAERLRKP
jgi:hypothetical protein